MSANQVLLFIIVGQNEPLYEAEIHKRGTSGNSDAVARQNYFVVHSALDLVEKASWTTQNVRSSCCDFDAASECSEANILIFGDQDFLSLVQLLSFFSDIANACTTTVPHFFFNAMFLTRCI